MKFRKFVDRFLEKKDVEYRIIQKKIGLCDIEKSVERIKKDAYRRGYAQGRKDFSDMIEMRSEGVE